MLLYVMLFFLLKEEGRLITEYQQLITIGLNCKENQHNMLEFSLFQTNFTREIYVKPYYTID